jgi:hypothetical protein
MMHVATFVISTSEKASIIGNGAISRARLEVRHTSRQGKEMNPRAQLHMINLFTTFV